MKRKLLTKSSCSKTRLQQMVNSQHTDQAFVRVHIRIAGRCPQSGLPVPAWSRNASLLTWKKAGQVLESGRWWTGCRLHLFFLYWRLFFYGWKVKCIGGKERRVRKRTAFSPAMVLGDVVFYCFFFFESTTDGDHASVVYSSGKRDDDLGLRSYKFSLLI